MNRPAYPEATAYQPHSDGPYPPRPHPALIGRGGPFPAPEPGWCKQRPLACDTGVAITARIGTVS